MAANSGFLTAEVKELHSVRDTNVTHYRLKFLLTLN